MTALPSTALLATLPRLSDSFFFCTFSTVALLGDVALHVRLVLEHLALVGLADQVLVPLSHVVALLSALALGGGAAGGVGGKSTHFKSNSLISKA